jgi:hypothetical protein
LDQANDSIYILDNSLTIADSNFSNIQNDVNILSLDLLNLQGLYQDSQENLNIALSNQEDGISQLDVDSVYQLGVSSVILEELYSDSLSLILDQSIYEIETLQSNLADIAVENDSLHEELDSLQATIDLLILNDSLHPEPNMVHEVEIPLLLPQGWGMFGYTCIDSMSVADAFIPIEDRVILIKNNNGEIYFPEFNFNGLGDLVYSRGYQSYLTEEVFNFSICPTLVVE